MFKLYRSSCSLLFVSKDIVIGKKVVFNEYINSSLARDLRCWVFAKYSRIVYITCLKAVGFEFRHLRSFSVVLVEHGG